MVVSTLLNGLSQAMLLFIIASGLSLIFGILGIVNFAHGSFYTIGAYIGVFLLSWSDAFWVALVIAPIFVLLLGVFTERLLIQPLYDRDPIYVVLLTFGLAIIIEELVILIWGTGTQSLPAPAILSESISIAGGAYPTYRLFIIISGIVLYIFLELLMNNTKVGITIRAGNLDREMVSAMGINIDRVFTGTFAFGIGLAAIAGVAAGPVFSVYPVMGSDILIDSFIVVVIGGLGSIRGPFLGALLVGLIRSFGGVYADQYVGFLIFGLLAIVLLVRPRGLLGRPGVIQHD
jgi:branched-subunit amino acid ABC-type transport system permease component